MAHGTAGPGLEATDGSTVDVQKPEPTTRALRTTDPEALDLLREILLELKRLRLGQEMLLEQEIPEDL